MAEATTVCSTFWGCIYSFQTLIGGMLAVLAAAGTAWTVWRSASLPVRARAQHEKESTERRRQHECVLLSSDLKVLSRRASQARGSIRAIAAANRDVTDKTKEGIYLVMPSVFVEWEVMSLLLPEIVQKCLHLRQKLIDHNFDVARAGGAFGADNFRAILLRRLEEIMTEATDLAGELGNVPVQNR